MIISGVIYEYMTPEVMPMGPLGLEGKYDFILKLLVNTILRLN